MSLVRMPPLLVACIVDVVGVAVDVGVGDDVVAVVGVVAGWRWLIDVAGVAGCVVCVVCCCCVCVCLLCGSLFGCPAVCAFVCLCSLLLMLLQRMSMLYFGVVGLAF